MYYEEELEKTFTKRKGDDDSEEIVEEGVRLFKSNLSSIDYNLLLTYLLQ